MINQVILVGRLTKDPEIKYTQEGHAVANVTLAVSRNFKSSAGEIDADYVNCTLWRKTAENTANYCKKGSIVGVSGRIQTRSYENNEGRRIFVTDVLADSVKFMGGKPRELVENER
jgi:single-strand DNA-binding protein